MGISYTEIRLVNKEYIMQPWASVRISNYQILFHNQNVFFLRFLVLNRKYIQYILTPEKD